MKSTLTFLSLALKWQWFKRYVNSVTVLYVRTVHESPPPLLKQDVDDFFKSTSCFHVILCPEFRVIDAALSLPEPWVAEVAHDDGGARRPAVVVDVVVDHEAVLPLRAGDLEEGLAVGVSAALPTLT